MNNNKILNYNGAEISYKIFQVRDSNLYTVLGAVIFNAEDDVVISVTSPDTCDSEKEAEERFISKAKKKIDELIESGQFRRINT